MKRSQSNTVNMKLKNETIDTNAMTNMSSSADSPHHRRYSESALYTKRKEDPQEKKQRLYKTEICRNWEEQNTCRYGEKCQYAHGKEELRFVKRHPRYKTIYCQTFETLGTCPYGIRCTFLHESPPHDLQSSLDSFKSDLPENDPAPKSNSHSQASHTQASPTTAPDYSTWARSRYLPQLPPALYVNDNMTPAHPPLTTTMTQPPVTSPSSLLPRPSISSSSSTSSSSILSTSSPTIFSSLSQQQQGNHYMNFYHDYQQNRMGYIDDYQKQYYYWHHPPYFENHHFAPQQHDKPIKTQKYKLPGSCSAKDLFTNGDGFHSALGVVPPSTSSTLPSVLPLPSFSSQHTPSDLFICNSSSTSFANHKYHLIN